MEQLSYLKALGLGKHPFPVAPDDESFFMSEHIEQIIAEVEHGILARKGFMVISGDVGLGKTTITRRILNNLTSRGVNTSLVFHTSLKDVDLLREINRDFGIAVDGGSRPGRDGFGDELQRLYDFLMRRYRDGGNCAIIIDDAQNLDRDSLELVRMISNLECDQQKLVQILLVGQPELMATLGLAALRQLRSRIIIAKTVRALDEDELRSYILFKLNLAGNQGRISVTNAGFKKLFRISRGNFRSLNVLMDRCLYAVCNDGSRQIRKQTVKMAHADMLPAAKRRWLRIPAMAAGIVLPFLLAAAAWTVHLQTSRTVSADAGPTRDYYKIPSQPQNKNETTKTTGNFAIQAQPAVPGDIVAFLKAHGMEPFSREFDNALRQGTLDAVGKRIFNQYGFKLVKLPALPEAIRRQYGALAYSDRTTNEPVWLLLWQPTLAFDRFFYHYKGEDVRRLQTLLARQRYYRHRIDGIVGTRLMKALIAFQKEQRLPVTGFPDAATLFLLCNQQEGQA